MQILKIWRVWLKIWACHAHLNFELQMGVAGQGLLKVWTEHSTQLRFDEFLSSQKFCENN